MLATVITVILIGAALILCTIASIWFLIAVFKENVLWGLAVLFLPVAGLIFLILHWEDVRVPFLLNLVGCILMAIAIFGGLSITPSELLAGTTTSANQPEAPKDPSFSFTELKEKRNKKSREKELKKKTANRGYTGRSLTEVERELGPPQGKISKTDGSTYYYYSNLELISSDGITVTDEIHR